MDDDGRQWSQTFPRWDETSGIAGSCGTTFPFFTPTSDSVRILPSSFSSFFFFSTLFLHLLLPVCWLRPAGLAVPTITSSPHSGQRAVVVTSNLILSFDHLVCELQLLSVNIHPQCLCHWMLRYNVGQWHTMMNRFLFFAWYSVLRPSSEAEHLSRWPIHPPIAIELQK